MHDLGKLYSTNKNEEKSSEYYREALNGFTEIEPNADFIFPYESDYQKPGRNTLRELSLRQLKDADTPEKHRNCVISFGERQFCTGALAFADFNMFHKVS